MMYVNRERYHTHINYTRSSKPVKNQYNANN